MKKGWVIGCGIAAAIGLVCGGGITLLVVFVFNTLAEFGKPADQFLAQVASGDTAGAYQSAASGLRTAQTQEQFDASVRGMRLTEYQSSSWSKFDMKNDQAQLEGTITLKDGSTLPVTVDLVKEGGWKVLGIKPATGGVSGGDAPRLSVPPDDELKKLANRDLAAFHRAVKADDFREFHATLSKPFREQKTAEELRQSFRVFVEKMIDLSAVETVDPKLTRPATIDADGVLQVEGEYPTRPAKVLFALKYVRDSGEWKLLGINVKTEAAE